MIEAIGGRQAILVKDGEAIVRGLPEGQGGKKTGSAPSQGVGSRLHSPRVGGGSSRPSFVYYPRTPTGPLVFICHGFFVIYRCSVCAHSHSPSFGSSHTLPCVSRSPLGQTYCGSSRKTPPPPSGGLTELSSVEQSQC